MKKITNNFIARCLLAEKEGLYIQPNCEDINAMLSPQPSCSELYIALNKYENKEEILEIIKQEFGMELYDICKRRLELSTNANRDNLEKILEWLKKDE